MWTCVYRFPLMESSTERAQNVFVRCIFYSFSLFVLVFSHLSALMNVKR